ncbi:MAG: tetratricopeptide repeat protein, partial [Bacteroides sp.]
VNAPELAVNDASFAQPDLSKAAADSAYVREDYAEAISIYEALLEKGVSAEVYYNLGNSYYKSDNIAKAILNYERAVLLSPNNKDYKANLAIASAKKVDKDEEVSELFFISWGKAMINWMSSDQWAVSSIVLFIVFLVSLGLFFLTKQVLIKKVGFFVALLTLLAVPITTYCASYQKNRVSQRNTAIVMEPSITVRSTPTETGTSLFVLHEGKKVKIKDNSMKSWKEIELENGEVGWLPAESIEII